jgi:hypothetical protein
MSRRVASVSDASKLACNVAILVDRVPVVMHPEPITHDDWST